MNCLNCGVALHPNDKFCSNCGRSIQNDVSSRPNPDPKDFASPIPPPSESYRGDGKAEIGRWVNAGWEMVTSDFLMFVLLALVFLVINSAVPFILQGPLMVGVYFACMRKQISARLDVADMFKGFNFFVPALLAMIVISAFTFIGSLFCLIPGLVIAAMYQFTYLFIFDKKMEFWPAMKASHNLVRNDYFGFTVFFFVLGLLALAGALFCLVGILFTLPLYFACGTAAYKDLVGFEPNPE
ncbi:MAG: hypothetical protein U0V70_02695 [Terriglobia bacterium]